MDLLKKKILFLAFALLILPGCQLGYILRTAHHHFSLLAKKVSFDKALADPSIPEEDKRKIRLAIEARNFSGDVIGLKVTDNYQHYVRVPGQAVSYVVSAAEPWALQAHEWSFPLVGKFPYKGFPEKSQAAEEENSLQAQGYDTWLRGVSAYSTLGWFSDPLFSTMLAGEDHELVDVIIHESTHATLYIKNSADFNERMAVFVAAKGTEQFYLAKEGANSKTVLLMKDENFDTQIFSEFISQEIKDLDAWYKSLPKESQKAELKTARIAEIQTHFQIKIANKLKTKRYVGFSKINLNNARLLYFKTYLQDLSDFEKLWVKSNANWKVFLSKLMQLKAVDKPEEKIKAI